MNTGGPGLGAWYKVTDSAIKFLALKSNSDNASLMCEFEVVNNGKDFLGSVFNACQLNDVSAPEIFEYFLVKY
ncbi:hypothetical protein BGAL_0042g00080 [Botrytis galanthina]|uniref:Uncharacterized protein n=1 Tax=Botrytis galanthina TaxID=278940 RepID=A0A4S8R715_9HELO|nr:hypothetical protein BGAL_0042g00080 [Botrytis galanthina]